MIRIDSLHRLCYIVNMKNKVLIRFAIAFTVLTIAAFAVSITPVLFTVLLAFLALVASLFALIVLLFGGFIGLLAMASDNSIWEGTLSFATTLFDWAGRLFSVVPPMARFCITSLSPISAGVAVGFGIVALIFSIMMVVATKSQKEAPAAVEEVREEVQEETGDPQKKSGKAKKPKKKKTERKTAVTCLILGIVFTSISALAIGIFIFISHYMIV